MAGGDKLGPAYNSLDIGIFSCILSVELAEWRERWKEHIMNMLDPKTDDPVQHAALARLAEVAIAAVTHVPAETLRSPRRGRRPIALARQMAMYLAHVAFGLTFTRVGICFGRDRTTVRHACALIEDRRDDPALEFGLSALEAGLRALTGALTVTARVEGRS
jgi:chromosomal replication initiation ATPase DnaA